MLIPGQRIKRTRLIQSKKHIVGVEVEMAIPDQVASEPCHEPDTVRLLREVKERADRGDVEWLSAHGRVYRALDAA